MMKKRRAIIVTKNWRQTQLTSPQLNELVLKANTMKLRARVMVPGHSSLVSPLRPRQALTTSIVWWVNVLVRESLVVTGLSMFKRSIKTLMALKKAETTSNVLVLAAMHALKVSITFGSSHLGPPTWVLPLGSPPTWVTSHLGHLPFGVTSHLGSPPTWGHFPLGVTSHLGSLPTWGHFPPGVTSHLGSHLWHSL
jgi:hypothetical protein